MKNEITVKLAQGNEYNKIMELYQDQKIQDTFQGYRPDRLAATEIAFLIYCNNTPIGFILLVRENDRRDSLGIDMGIKKEYRGKGYGTQAIRIFKENILHRIDPEENIHAEVSKKNIAANKILEVLDKEYIETIDNSDFYKIKR